tara:strand:+ start:11433 stop:12188 length:756 start_codon:yes stop_codon:yes gene_type:complete
MNKTTRVSTQWDDLKIGITGASGALGKSLTTKLKEKGAYIIGITSKNTSDLDITKNSPNEWIQWKCGEEKKLDKTLSKLDILILNHGINYQGSRSNEIINNSLEINALSVWRLIERFEYIANQNLAISTRREIWVNTSEAEVQPALSPTYEISKRLLGQLVSIKMNGFLKDERSSLNIRKIILGPFRSKLNPIGIMNSEKVASKIIKLAELNLNIIIVSPNPITYLLIPLSEISRFIYLHLTNKFNPNPQK